MNRRINSRQLIPVQRVQPLWKWQNVFYAVSSVTFFVLAMMVVNKKVSEFREADVLLLKKPIAGDC